MMALAMPSVADTMMGLSTLGRTWRGDDAPPAGADAARRGHELAFLQRQHVAAHDARSLHPARDADDEHDEQEDPGLRPERGAQGVRGTA